MNSEPLSVLHPFILSWNTRNSYPNAQVLPSEQTCITGTCSGEYPIDGWVKYYLEVPKEGNKKDISGRSNIASASGESSVEWNLRRTINLPIYSNSENYTLENLGHVIEHWDEIGIPDDIPCIAIAMKCSGFYSEYREAQYVTVLTVWSDATARIISLDWFEGPLEDCITPEWYIKCSALMNLNKAFEDINNLYGNTNWDSPSFSIYTIPKCLGLCLEGKKARAPYDQWKSEWNYTDYDGFCSDLALLITDIQKVLKLTGDDVNA